MLGWSGTDVGVGEGKRKVRGASRVGGQKNATRLSNHGVHERCAHDRRRAPGRETEVEIAMKTVPYLVFQGNCEEAMTFYAKALGGKIESIYRFKEAPPDMPRHEGMDDKIMHVHVVAEGAELMGSDAPPQYYQKPQGTSVSLHVETAGDAERIFNALAGGGQVTMPIAKTFWAERFGMLTDRYGIPWMVDCPAAR
jgi:PhnB protein